MKEYDTDSFPHTCTNCGKEIMIRLSDFKKGNFVTCSHCNSQFQSDGDDYKEVQDSLRDLQKSFSDQQKKIDKSRK